METGKTIPEVTEKLNIKEQIAAIRAEKIPKERDTPIGRKSWQMEQLNRIKNLEKQLT